MDIEYFCPLLDLNFQYLNYLYQIRQTLQEGSRWTEYVGLDREGPQTSKYQMLF